MPKTANRIHGQTTVSYIFFLIKMVITDLLSCFFIILYRLLDCKMAYDRFWIFFFFYKNSLLPVLIQNRNLIGVI